MRSRYSNQSTPAVVNAVRLCPALHALESQSYSPRDILPLLGLTVADVESSAFVAKDSLQRLIALGEKITNDRHFGLHAGSYAKPEHMGILAYLVKSSPCAREAYSKLKRFKHLLSSTELDLSAVFNRNEVIIRYAPHEASSDKQAMAEYWLAYVYACAPQLCGWPIRVKKVCFTDSKPPDAAIYEEFFNAPVSFNEKFNALVVENPASQPFAYANPYLFQEMQIMLSLSRQKSPDSGDDFMQRLQQHILEELNHSQPKASNICEKLFISESTLRRRLAEKSTSFHKELDKVLSKLAFHLLANCELSIKQIADELKYSDPGAFHRAFRRWTGLTPTQYVQQLQLKTR